MKANRRNFIKSTLFGLGSLGFIGKISGLSNEAFAAGNDSKIKKQGYISKGQPTEKASIKKYKVHTKKLNKALAKVGKAEGSTNPKCKNCKYFKTKNLPEGYGKCAMVGATGKPGKMVNAKGWCKVWSVNKKALS